MSINNELLIGYYGDDFTGSTDAMEALTLNGVKTVLFLRPPSPEMLAKFPDLRGIGVAGVSRSLSPEEMVHELAPVFEALKQSGAPVIHYKTCSTFDSSLEVGSIGKAIDIARGIFDGQRYVPLLVGAPSLKRYTVFGNHFATVGGAAYRLDRHPVMSKHPITPMHEADLAVHLSKQTDEKIGLINILELSGTLAEDGTGVGTQN
jgi:uncharacterized protein YgbK (DUF1537 family)